MKKSRLLGAVCFCLFSAFTQAATITYSGLDLYNDPNVSFPTLNPTLNGTSLVFGTGATVRYQKLLVLPLFPSGSLSTSSPTTISVSVNVTRLACDTSAGCAGGEQDSDHHFALGDGVNLVGGAASDGIGGAGTISVYSDNGDSAGLTSGQVVFSNAGYPTIGSSFDINMVFTLDTTTSIDLSFLDGQETATGLQGLNRATSIDFVFLKEGDPGEQYQINSLSFTSDALVPIPPALYLFGSGLLGLIGIARRKAA